MIRPEQSATLAISPGPADGSARLRGCRLRQDGGRSPGGDGRRNAGRRSPSWFRPHCSPASTFGSSRNASRTCLSRCVSSPGWSRAKRPPPRNRSWRGDCDIVVGTHALLAKSINFKDLGLVIVDEEQPRRAQKERLKEFGPRSTTTLTATPIRGPCNSHRAVCGR